MATSACLTKTIVGDILIALTDQGNLKLEIFEENSGVGWASVSSRLLVSDLLAVTFTFHSSLSSPLPHL